MSGFGGNVIEGNFIGTDVAGMTDLGNTYGSFVVVAANNRIGGANSSSRNVISGNDAAGVAVFDSDGNQILGNYIGTDASGEVDLGNVIGIYLDQSRGNTIGGPQEDSANLISDHGRKSGCQIVPMGL